MGKMKLIIIFFIVLLYCVYCKKPNGLKTVFDTSDSCPTGKKRTHTGVCIEPFKLNVTIPDAITNSSNVQKSSRSDLEHKYKKIDTNEENYKKTTANSVYEGNSKKPTVKPDHH